MRERLAGLLARGTAGRSRDGGSSDQLDRFATLLLGMLPIRLGAMLREDSRTLVGIVLAVVATTAGCNGGSDKAAREETSSPVTIKATPAETTKAIRCLHEAGLSSADQGHSGLWTGSHQSPAYRIVVHKLAKPAKAPRVVAGEYAVTGSFKVVAVGRGLIGNDGIQADALVQTVAECLSS